MAAASDFGFEGAAGSEEMQKAASLSAGAGFELQCLLDMPMLPSPGEFALWAAYRWPLLHEFFMDEYNNSSALGGEQCKACMPASACRSAWLQRNDAANGAGQSAHASMPCLQGLGLLSQQSDSSRTVGVVSP